MSQIFRIVTIVGARPQFVKSAVLSRHILDCDYIDEIILHTGQHYDANMSDVFFDELKIPSPRYNLNISQSSHGEMTGKMLVEIEKILLSDRPDAVLVYGDTNSTLAGALAASKLGIKVVHVEAGLRSYNRTMPEEINRVITDQVSDLLLCPTVASVDNLRREGIANGVVHVGDIMYDATCFVRDRLDDIDVSFAPFITEQRYGVLTIHRQGSTESLEACRDMLAYANRYALDNDLLLAFPVHPRTRQLLSSIDEQFSAIRYLEPLGYFQFHRLLSGAELVLTDSGGVQKESYFHRIPCITLRTETEWTETIDCGWNRLWSVQDWLPKKDIVDYGSGDSGVMMLQEMTNLLGAS